MAAVPEKIDQILAVVGLIFGVQNLGHIQAPG
jgi:hypothetical protein